MNKNYTLKKVCDFLVILSLCSSCRKESSQVTPVIDKTHSGSSSPAHPDQSKSVDIPAPSVAPFVSLGINKEKETQHQQEANDDISRDEHSNPTHQPDVEVPSFLSLPPCLFWSVGQFLTLKDALHLAQVNKYCLNLGDSELDLKLTLENKILTEEDFLSRFGENGFYKEAQCLNLSGSSFRPAWLRHLPKTLKALILKKINTQGFRDPFQMKMRSLRVLGETLPNLKFLDISDNQIGVTGARLIAEKLKSLTSLNIKGNQLGVGGCVHIGEHLKSLTSLDISNNQIGVRGARCIAKNLKSLTSLNICNNHIGNRGVRSITKNLKALTYLCISNN